MKLVTLPNIVFLLLVIVIGYMGYKIETLHDSYEKTKTELTLTKNNHEALKDEYLDLSDKYDVTVKDKIIFQGKAEDLAEHVKGLGKEIRDLKKFKINALYKIQFKDSIISTLKSKLAAEGDTITFTDTRKVDDNNYRIISDRIYYEKVEDGVIKIHSQLSLKESTTFNIASYKDENGYNRLRVSSPSKADFKFSGVEKIEDAMNKRPRGSRWAISVNANLFQAGPLPIGIGISYQLISLDQLFRKINK